MVRRCTGWCPPALIARRAPATGAATRMPQPREIGPGKCATLTEQNLMRTAIMGAGEGQSSGANGGAMLADGSAARSERPWGEPGFVYV